MKTAKQEVLDMVSELPEECSLEDIQYHIYVRAKLDRALADVEAGRIVDHEEVERRSQKWLSE